MIKRELTPSELFSTVGETMSHAITQQKNNQGFRLSSMEMEMKTEISDDLQSMNLPSNEQKFMDGKVNTNLFKLRVKAY